MLFLSVWIPASFDVTIEATTFKSRRFDMTHLTEEKKRLFFCVRGILSIWKKAFIEILIAEGRAIKQVGLILSGSYALVKEAIVVIWFYTHFL